MNLSLKMNHLLEKSCSFVLDDRYQKKITSSTLSAEALKFLGVLIQEYKPKTLFEFGSGLSTSFLSNLIPDSHIFTIDHSLFYLNQSKKDIEYNSNITFLYCPIELFQFRGKKFATYDWVTLKKKLPKKIKLEFVLIDGPPGLFFGREAPLYQIHPYISSNTLIVLDDANREHEQKAIANWKRVWKNRMEIVHFSHIKKGLAIVKINSPHQTSFFPFSLKEIKQSREKAHLAYLQEVQRRSEEKHE